MECKNCKISLEENSRFCPECGGKIENQIVDLDKLYSKTSGCWFLLGMSYGSMKAKKDKEGIKELEEFIKKGGAYDQYNNALIFAKNHVLKSKLKNKGSQHP